MRLLAPQSGWVNSHTAVTSSRLQTALNSCYDGHALELPSFGGLVTHGTIFMTVVQKLRGPGPVKAPGSQWWQRNILSLKKESSSGWWES